MCFSTITISPKLINVQKHFLVDLRQGKLLNGSQVCTGTMKNTVTKRELADLLVEKGLKLWWLVSFEYLIKLKPEEKVIKAVLKYWIHLHVPWVFVFRNFCGYTIHSLIKINRILLGRTIVEGYLKVLCYLQSEKIWVVKNYHLHWIAGRANILSKYITYIFFNFWRGCYGSFSLLFSKAPASSCKKILN